MAQQARENPRLAALLIIAASAFIAGTMLFAKMLGTASFGAPLHPLQITFGRFFFAFLAISLTCAVMRPKIETIHWRYHIGRTTFGWMGVSMMFASVAYIPLADATAISFLNPVFAMMFAIPLLGEQVGRWRWIAAGISLVGAMILLRPTPDSFQPAALIALTAAVAMGVALTFIRRLATREAPLQVLLINNGLGVLIASCTVIFVWQTPTLAQVMLMAGVGFVMATAQAFFVNGMARADASFVAPFSYATLLFAALYDLVFYAVQPDGVTMIGAAVIIAGALLLAYREARKPPRA
ncbi:MAG: DMT family transporter [Rhodobacteraceae bacterium]|nr:DMT family transporter [Paracoccaceae bacterium]